MIDNTINIITLAVAVVGATASCYNACFIQRKWFDDYNKKGGNRDANTDRR